MSDYAVTPETYAAWRFLELNDELRPYDGERVEILRGNQELDLLLAGTETLCPPLLHSYTSIDLEESPSVDNFERFFKRGLELRCLTHRSLARTLERYRCQNVCIADLEARPEAYPEFGTEEEIRQHVAAIRRNDGDVAQLMTGIEEGQQSRAKNENLLATLNTLITRRHAQDEGDEEDQPDISHG